MKPKSTITNYLWKYRKEMGYTQKDVAYLLGHKDTSQICNWEKGIKTPSLENTIKLAIIYRKPVAFLFHYYYISIRKEIRAKEEKLRERINYYGQSRT